MKKAEPIALAKRPQFKPEHCEAEVRQVMGIPKSTISEVLVGKKPFSRQMIRKLAGYFGVEVGMLAGNL